VAAAAVEDGGGDIVASRCFSPLFPKFT